MLPCPFPTTITITPRAPKPPCWRILVILFNLWTSYWSLYSFSPKVSVIANQSPNSFTPGLEPSMLAATLRGHLLQYWIFWLSKFTCYKNKEPIILLFSYKLKWKLTSKLDYFECTALIKIKQWYAVLLGFHCIITGLKSAGFWSQHEISRTSGHTKELWYNETISLWMMMMMMIYIYIYITELR